MIDKLLHIINVFLTLAKVFYFCTIASIKALLPVGFLPKKDVKGEVVLITGASQGLGRELARRFASLKARLILWDIDENGLIELRNELEAQNVEVHIDKVDLSNKDEIRTLSRRVIKDFHHVDIVVMNAGMVNGKLFTETSEDAIERCMKVNALSHMYVDYCASKFAAVGICQSIAEELRASGINDIKTTLVCPGLITTGLFEGFHIPSSAMPPLSAEYVADRTMEAILTEADFVSMPKFCYLAIFAKGLLPTAAIQAVNDLFGVTHCMSGFIGREKKGVGNERRHGNEEVHHHE
ncbi:hypothetical protein WR25_26156 [Diploscapter pachys]|uniref:Uncharacterized protein n=1 Tax=Diploscapter pachys TaxID=2018661 RepID=A0A2A2J679_9BILA|nr:hypothetical protein WR25_26156 [Diploscapter pachys]